MVAQVVAVAAGQLLRAAQRVDLPDGLGKLEPQAVLKLERVRPRPFLRGAVQQIREVRHAAGEGHELHRHRVAPGQQVGIHPRQVVKNVVKGRDHAQLALDPDRIFRRPPDRRRGKAQQDQQQRQRHQQLRRRLRLRAADEQLRRQKAQPAPELAAEIRNEDADQRPQEPPRQRTQRQQQRQVDEQRVDPLVKVRAPKGVHAPLRQRDDRHDAPEQAAAFRLIQRTAEGRAEHAAEQADRAAVQDLEPRAHSSTLPRWNARSRNASFTSAYFPRGRGISVRQDMVMAR